MVVEFSCNDPAAVAAAVLADINNTKENEEEIRTRLGPDTAKVWREVKIFLDNKTCKVR